MKMAIVTACPCGFAHSRMAAEAFRREAQSLGYEVYVEEQGGFQNPQRLKPQQIAEADVVILATNIAIPDKDRFKGKKVLDVSAGEALRHPKETLLRAAKLAEGAA